MIRRDTFALYANLLDTMEAAGLLDADASFEEFEAVLASGQEDVAVLETLEAAS